MKSAIFFVGVITLVGSYAAQAHDVVINGTFKDIVVESGPAHVSCIGCSYTFAGDQLRITTAQPQTQSGTSHVVVNGQGSSVVHSVTSMAYGQGASASVVVNGVPVNTQTAAPPPATARVRLPAVNALKFSGTADVLTISPPMQNLSIQGVLQSGSATATRDLSVSLTGGGALRIGQATGAARMSLTGGGSVYVDAAELSSLDVQVVGGGEVQINGRAATARIQCIGTGRIAVTHIDRITARTAIGACNIETR